MAKRFKRAFTIVELVIVIAVIAILAAVLIPTFTTLIDKANQSNDTVTVKNLNTAIASAQATEEINTMQDALDAAQEYGYTVDKLTPSSSGDIVWDQVSKRFALVDKDGDVVYSDGTLSSGASLWKIAKDGELSAKYSNYLSGEWSGTIETGLGVDVGANEGLDVKYTNSNAQTVMFRTNGGTLTIDAPNDIVNHYGTAVKVVITEVKDSSYHLYGEVLGNIELAKGRVVVEDGASASTILVTSATAADIKIDVNNNATVGTVAATTAGVITSENTTVPSTTEKVEEAVVANNDFAGGIGTEKSPYLIETAEQLLNINNYGEAMSSGKEFSFKLINDIDLVGLAPVEYDYGLAYIENFVNSVLDGDNYQIKIDSATLIYTLYKSTLKNIVFNFNGMDCSIAGGNYVATTVYENIRTIGSVIFSDRNTGLYAIYAYGGQDAYEVKFINCINETTIAAPGHKQAYNAIFVGYSLQGAVLTFENCKNIGNFTSGKAGLFVGNQSQEGWVIKLNITNFENTGNVVSTYETTTNYSQVVASVVNKNNIFVIVDSQNHQVTDSLFPNVSVLAKDKTLDLTYNEDKTFTITQATVSDVAYYEVAYGTYVSWWEQDENEEYKTIGSQIEYIKEKIDSSKFVDGAYTTQMKWLDLVTYHYSPEGATSEEITIGDNKYNVVTIDGVEYYRMASEMSKLCSVEQMKEGVPEEGIKKASNYIEVSAYSKDGVVLATFTLTME